MHAANRKKDILVLSEGTRNELDGTKITAVAKYSANFTKLRKSLHYSRAKSFLYANEVKFQQITTKDSKIKLYPLCFG